MLTEDERTELHIRLRDIEEEAERAAALEAVRLATALRYRAREQREEPPLRMR